MSVASSSRSFAAHGKRQRPPTLSLSTSAAIRPPLAVLDLDTPLDDPAPSPGLHHAHTHAAAAATTTTPYLSAVSALSPSLHDDVRRHAPQLSGDLSRDLAVLEQLRRSVQKNLRLRPLRASPTSSQPPSRPLSLASTWSDAQSPSPTSATSSVYFTPVSERLSPPSPPPLTPSSSVSGPAAVDPAAVARRLAAPIHPILIDTRPVGAFLAAHIAGSVNVSIPSLILKRARQPGKGFPSLAALRQYITTDDGRAAWDALVRPASAWDGDVFVYDDDMDDAAHDNSSSSSTAWALLPVVQPLLAHGSADYIRGGMSAVRAHPDLQPFLVHASAQTTPLPSPPPPPLASASAQTTPRSAPQTATSPPLPPPRLSLPPKRRGMTLPLIDTVEAGKAGKPLPEIERSAVSTTTSSPLAARPWAALADATPSPPPSQSTFPRRRPSQPTLARLNTKSAERLTVSIPRQQPTRSATLTAPPGPWPPSPSPQALNLVYSTHAPTPASPLPRAPSAERLAPPSAASSSSSSPSPSTSSSSASASPLSAPLTPRTPLPPVPHTARQDDTAPSTESPFPTFTVSTILPHFLFLGPEPTEEAHVRQLEAAGVRRILNLAIECDADDHGLALARRFERYAKIPMRDTVEEENIVRGVREACDILDDASLHSAPTYVHCKAGKSRSVTAVMAYLIHANHWTLSRAYTFVLERRRGISPNIGFVSELMNFEELELGGKSIGVVKDPPADHHGEGGAGADGGAGGGGDAGGGGGGGGSMMNYGQAAGARRPAHLRESLPPAFTLSADQVMLVGVGDVGQETEVKDASGRYRHARRAPVDENTLQPLRRVSKAGLESALQSDFGAL